MIDHTCRLSECTGEATVGLTQYPQASKTIFGAYCRPHARAVIAALRTAGVPYTVGSV